VTTDRGPSDKRAAEVPADRARTSLAGGSHDSARWGRLLIVLAAVLWSSSGLFAKAPLFGDWPSDVRGPLLAFWRALFAGLLLLPWVRGPRFTVQLIPLGALFTVMNVTYLSAMTLTTAANAIWLQCTAPWWVFLVGVVVLRQPFPTTERLPLVIGGAGLAIILWFQVQGQDRWGVLLGLIAGLSYAGVVLSLRALRHYETVWIVAVAHLVTAAAIFPYVLYLDRWPSAGQLAVLAGFGIFQMGLPYVLFARGLRSITSQEATGIGLLEPILLPLWVYLVWNEEPAGSTLAGGSLILAGLALRYAVPFIKRREDTLD
jgi:DME family drug/metabolite transporter